MQSNKRLCSQRAQLHKLSNGGKWGASNSARRRRHIKLQYSAGASNGFRPFNLVFHILQLAGQFLIRDEVRGYECRIFKGGAPLKPRRYVPRPPRAATCAAAPRAAAAHLETRALL